MTTKSLPVSLVAAFAAVSACGPSAIPQPSAIHVASAQRRYPSATHATLAAGRQLLLERCGGCHSVPTPAARPPDQWPAVVRDMASRARLDEPSRLELEAYLVGASSVR